MSKEQIAYLSSLLAVAFGNRRLRKVRRRVDQDLLSFASPPEHRRSLRLPDSRRSHGFPLVVLHILLCFLKNIR